jgi:hypothetical protein
LKDHRNRHRCHAISFPRTSRLRYLYRAKISSERADSVRVVATRIEGYRNRIGVQDLNDVSRVEIHVGYDAFDRPSIREIRNLLSQICEGSAQSSAFLSGNAEVPDHPGVDPDVVKVVDPPTADRVLPARIQLDELDRRIVFLEKERALQSWPCVPLEHLSAIERNHAIVEPMGREVVHDHPSLPLERLPCAEIMNDPLRWFEEPDFRKAGVTGQLWELQHDRTSQPDLIGRQRVERVRVSAFPGLRRHVRIGEVLGVSSRCHAAIR